MLMKLITAILVVMLVVMVTLVDSDFGGDCGIIGDGGISNDGDSNIGGVGEW